MAVVHTNISGGHTPLLNTVVERLARMMENHPRMRQIDHLNHTTDAELAARGLTRKDVVRHIFRDRYMV
ncbi:hypothetical protein C8N32_10571 [Rhodovulum imhoffii]|uniref:DUF1127 domain-containing protein n=1 Tax=Rhodovulum imhoffii TaxID=365340 RepID=A0A2T5BTE8_9RHOB|nr:DUF1127 domain-containing protein [Rhodovulum imhoffii]MBK5934348.1 hypothetical protein [Rhodovulum imhoffii]PTN02701.1 hypothetical protein C8N32_10571 [Rhodovulum imhoffii]